MAGPKISVIIPAKNEEYNLSRLLPILRRQTVNPEIIVAVAPGTTDKTRVIARRYRARVVKGGLPSVGRNAGAHVAKGEFLFFLDADVIPGSRNFLEGAVKEMIARKLNAASVNNYAPARERRLFRVFFYGQNAVIRTLALCGSHQSPGTCIIAHKNEHKRIKGFRPKVVWNEDVEYIQRTRRFGLLSKKFFIYTSTRRLKKDGVLGTLRMAVKAQWHRKVHGEIRDLSYIDAEYFNH